MKAKKIMFKQLIFLFLLASSALYSAQMTPQWSGGRWPGWYSENFKEQFNRLDEWDKDYYRRHQREIVKAMKWGYYEREERIKREFADRLNNPSRYYPKQQIVQPTNGIDIREIRDRSAREETYASCCVLCCVFVVAPMISIAAEVIKTKMKQD